jgi:Kef-type K+ transport system membrane component KefB
MDHGIISDIAICVMAAWILAVTAHLLKQPLILAYLIAGFAIGPAGLGWVAQDSVQTISALGLILLLFMIGLEIDLKKILSAGRLITITGICQIVGCFLLGLAFFGWASDGMGIRFLEVIYLAVAASLGSTVIVVKLLYDKRELNTLPGRITLGILVLQDVFAILFLAVQPELGDPHAGPILWSLAKVLFLVGVAFAASRYALPPWLGVSWWAGWVRNSVCRGKWARWFPAWPSQLSRTPWMSPPRSPVCAISF